MTHGEGRSPRIRLAASARSRALRLYRVQKRLKGNPYKLELMKYNPILRMRTLHKEVKK